MSRSTALFAGACLLALLVGHMWRDSPGYMVRNPDGTVTGDITHYVYWTRLVTLGGIQSAYGGTWPETYAVYAPVTLLPFEAIGILYQHLQDPSFDRWESVVRDGNQWFALIQSVDIWELPVHSESLGSRVRSVVNPAD